MRTFHNTATCLKATYSVADAVFLVNNQRFIEKDSSLINNMSTINKLIVEPFYDLLCAGEVKKAKHVGARLLDAGDIIQSLGGWTVMGYGISQLSAIRIPFVERRNNYRNKSTETHKGLQAMEQAISNLSIVCSPEDSSSALYLLSAPTKDMNMMLVKELGEYLSEVAPEAIIRYGDYPRGGNTLTITVILSQLNSVNEVKRYYEKMPDLIYVKERRQKDNKAKLRELMDASTVVPSLFDGDGNGN